RSNTSLSAPDQVARGIIAGATVQVVPPGTANQHVVASIAHQDVGEAGANQAFDGGERSPGGLARVLAGRVEADGRSAGRIEAGGIVAATVPVQSAGALVADKVVVAAVSSQRVREAAADQTFDGNEGIPGRLTGVAAGICQADHQADRGGAVVGIV